MSFAASTSVQDIYCPITVLSVMEGLTNQRAFLRRDPRWLQRDIGKSKTKPSEITVTEAFNYVNMVRRASDKKMLKKEHHACDYMFVANNEFSKRLVLQRAATENFVEFPIWASCVRAPGM